LDFLISFLFDNISNKYVLAFAVFVALVLVVLAISYLTRIKDHIREESRIDDIHFRKVKDYIKDLCDSIEDQIISKGSSIYDSEIKSIKSTVVGSSEDGQCQSSCLKLHEKDVELMIEKVRSQEERWDNDCRRAIDTKIYSKSCGWMRENGFYDWKPEDANDSVKLNDYVATRSEQSVKAFIPYLKSKSKLRTPLITSSIHTFYTEEQASIFVKDITEYTILEMQEAYKEIKEYRLSHGFMPEFVSKILTVIFSRDKK